MHTQKKYKSINRSALLDNENNTTKVEFLTLPPKKKKKMPAGWPGGTHLILPWLTRTNTTQNKL
jgi:hypothetical protein